MLSRVPFVGLVLTLMAGIVFAEKMSVYFSGGLLLNSTGQTGLIVLLAALSGVLFRQRKLSAFGVCLSLFFFLAGVLAFRQHEEMLNDQLEMIAGKGCDFYQARIVSIPEKRARSIRVDAMVENVHQGGKWVTVNARAYLSIPQDASQIPSAGDQIIVEGALESPKPPLNPEEFDYKKYLGNKGVAWTDYLPDHSYQVMTQNERSGIYAWSQYVSQWADRQFRENIADDRSYGLVKAMILGRRDDLRSDQVDDYTTSGTVHILSVSGMHVAIIFLVLSYLLGWMKRLRGGKYIYLITITLLLGFYAVITGLPPSVQRAALMCVVFVIAEVFNRKQMSINTLSLSALIILLLDPKALFDVGFQLSYLAMAGIFLFYKPIESRWQPQNWLLKYIWQNTALSFAAQLATFPLSLYYFHQFPFYFWLVNPFVITFTNALLPAALVLLFVCLWPFLWLKWLAGWLVYLLAFLTNISVAVPKSLPGYLIENLYLDQFEVILLYVIIFLGWYTYESRAFYWLRFTGVLTMFFVIYSTSASFQKYAAQKGMIHSIPKYSVLSFKQGDQMIILSDSAFTRDTSAYAFYIKNYGISEGVLHTTFITGPGDVPLMDLSIRKIGEGTVLLWRNKIIVRGKYFVTNAAVDYCLLSSAKYPRIQSINPSAATMFLIGGEVKKRSRERWHFLFQKSNTRLYDLQTQGAYLLP